MKRASRYEVNSPCRLSFILLCVFFFSLVVYAQDSEFGRIIGDRKYFGRDYIVKNPRAIVPSPTDIPLAKMDSTQPFEFLRVVSRVEPQECFGWTEDQRICNFDRMSDHPRIAVSGDTIHIVWQQDLEGPHEEVYYSRSTNGGVIWEDSLLLSVIDNHESFQQDVAVEHDNVYVVWAEVSSGQDQGIYFRKSTDGGRSWGSIRPIALAGPDYYGLYCPTIAARDSVVFVIYQKHIDGQYCLRHKKSSDYGETWSGEIPVSERGSDGISPKMVCNNAGLYVVHQSGLKIWCNRSTDWGDSWSDDIFISDMDSSIAQWPSIGADDNGGVYVTWFDYRYSPYGWTGDIFLRRSTDNGVTWDSIISLTNNHLCIESDVCADTSSAHVVWHDERYNMGNGNVEIYHRRSTNLGATWSGETRLTDAPCQSYDPRIVTSSGWVHMVWLDARDGRADVFHKKGGWYFRGDTNQDNIINVTDVVYLINYLFTSGPPPTVFKSGDVNNDNQVNVTDVVYLINYLFVGGPPPAGC
jgi:hypothetical protein